MAAILTAYRLAWLGLDQCQVAVGVAGRPWWQPGASQSRSFVLAAPRWRGPPFRALHLDSLTPASNNPAPISNDAADRKTRAKGKGTPMTHPSDHDQPANVYAYNLDTATTPAGIKVRWRVRIATGTEAERLDIIQQDAIINLLTWADKHHKTNSKPPCQTPEIPSGNSPAPVAIHAE